MQGWMTLGAAIGGAMIALLGQQFGLTRERRSRRIELLMEQCAVVLALAGDYRNRVWEERELGVPSRVEGWDLAAFRLAAAKITILSTDQDLNDAVTALRNSGSDLGRFWRSGGRDSERLAELGEAYGRAIDKFGTIAARAVGRRLGRV